MMKIRMLMLLVFFALSGQVLAEKVSVVKKISAGEYEVLIDGKRFRAFSPSQLKTKYSELVKCEQLLISGKKLVDQQDDYIKDQGKQLDRMDDQIKDYRTLTTKLEELLRLKPGFNASYGLSYVNGNVGGMIGIGYSDLRLIGFGTATSTGVLISKDF